MYDALTRGYPWYGADLGIAVLDGGIPAPIGDVSNVHSFGVPVQYDVLPGIGGLDLIGGLRDDVERSLLDSVERLASRGARIAFTGCGMLGQYQRIAADAAPIPIGTSSLLQVPLALRLVPSSRRVLVLGVDAAWVREEHLVSCGVHPDDLDRVIVKGLETATHFRGNLLGEFDVFDPERARDEVLAILADAIEDSPEIAAIVFECTNLGPYSAAARSRFGIPVWDAVALADWLAAGVTTPQLAVPSAPSTRG